MPNQKTHRIVKNPRISARHLADYMAASEQVRRRIVRDCKYQLIARMMQHNEAKMVVGKFLRKQTDDTSELDNAAALLRNRMADTPFDRALLDVNADYIARFAKMYPALVLPEADALNPGKPSAINLNDTRVSIDIACRLRRITQTNKVRVGAVALRYAKGRPLPAAVAEWQAAFLYGYLGAVGVEDGADPERKLCVIIDAYAGICHAAPGNSIRRFHNMEAACATIAERWPRVSPPAKAVL